MKRRIAASIAFLIGGVVTWFVLLLLRTLGNMEAGMSDGAASIGPSSADKLIPWTVCGYFGISAVSVWLARNRATLRVGALFSHSMLLITLLLIFSTANRDEDSGKLFSAVVTLIGIMALYFSPWIFAWLLAFSSFPSPDKPISAEPANRTS